MPAAATPSLSRGLLRHSKWDAVLIGLSLVHPVAIVLVPSIPIVALGLWWNANTVSHNFIHLPFFRSKGLNRAYSIFLSLLLGFPQSVWRHRHLAHHRGRAAPLGFTPQVAVELAAVLTLWGALIVAVPGFFWLVYLPGWALGLGLCQLQGYFEHAGGATSHYGLLYNLSFFNDGYHVEHHRRPSEHWTRIPDLARPGERMSAWPPVLRWIDRVDFARLAPGRLTPPGRRERPRGLRGLEGLERLALRARPIQRFLLTTHERALRRLLPDIPDVRRVTVVGGGLFPRTAILLRTLLPGATIAILDASAASVHTAREFLAGRDERVTFEVGQFDPRASSALEADLVVIPLSFTGDRREVYRHPPARAVLVHDWIWSRKGRSVVISPWLLKRLNLVSR